MACHFILEGDKIKENITYITHAQHYAWAPIIANNKLFAVDGIVIRVGVFLRLKAVF